MLLFLNPPHLENSPLHWFCRFLSKAWRLAPQSAVRHEKFNKTGDKETCSTPWQIKEPLPLALRKNTELSWHHYPHSTEKWLLLRKYNLHSERSIYWRLEIKEWQYSSQQKKHGMSQNLPISDMTVLSNSQPGRKKAAILVAKSLTHSSVKQEPRSNKVLEMRSQCQTGKWRSWANETQKQ